MIDIQTMEWRGEGRSFHHWFLAEIDELVGQGLRIRVGGRERAIAFGDFGFSDRTIRNWRIEMPPGFPAAKKLKDIVDSIGFRYLSEQSKRQVILAWIANGLHAKSEPSENLVHLLKLLVENASPDFLVKSAKEAFEFHR